MDIMLDVDNGYGNVVIIAVKEDDEDEGEGYCGNIDY